MKSHSRISLTILTALIVSLLSTSCGNKLTVCECMNPPDEKYEQKCREWFTHAPHEEYVQMMKEKENCK